MRPDVQIPDRITAIIAQARAWDYHRQAHEPRVYRLFSATSDNPTARRHYQRQAEAFYRMARRAMGIEP